MSKETVRSGFDSWVGSAKPDLEHPREKTLNLKTGAAYALLWMRVPTPRGATVTRATLTLKAKGASSGSRVITVNRIADPWKEARVTWATKPTVATGNAATKTVGALTDAATIDLDVTGIVQSWANGAKNLGFRISTDATTQHSIYGLNSSEKPVLTVEWSDAPSKPTNLRPSEASTSLAKPYVTFDYLDYFGDTSVASVRVQIASDAAMTASLWDSGEIAATESGLDLSTTTFTGLTAGQKVFWRVMVKDGAGLWSVWSDVVSMTRTAKPAMTITNLGAGVVKEPTPLILWSMAGQVRWKVLVFDTASPSKPIHDSGQRTGSASSYTIPSGVLKKTGTTYAIEVRGWDNVVREATPGDDVYASATALCTLATEPTVGPIDTLSAAAVDVSPWVDLTWTRSTTPDAFVLLRDGEIVNDSIDPASVFVSGSTYRFRYYGARPNREHTYAVRAVTFGTGQSPNGPTATFTTSPSGLWLVDFDRGVNVTLWGNDEGSWTMQDDASVYTPVGSTQVVRIVSGMRGLEGSLTGLLMEGFGKTFEQMEADVYAIKERPTQTVRIVAGDENFTALIGNVRISPKPETRQGRIVKGVSLDFWQIGSLPFTPKI